MLTVDSVKLLIGDYKVVEFDEHFLEKAIQKYDEDASYNDAFLVVDKDAELYLVFKYNDYTRVVNDSFDDGISDEDAYIETIKNEIGDFFGDIRYDDRFYTMLEPLFVDIYQTINEYGLDKEQFLNSFYAKDGLVDFDTVEYFKHCLDRGEITSFISENY